MKNLQLTILIQLLEDLDQPMVFNYPDYSTSAEIFNHSTFHNSNLQLNWVLPVSNTSKLESGIQGIIRGTNNDYYQNILEEDSWVKDTNTIITLLIMNKSILLTACIPVKKMLSHTLPD